jgi:hypothetical protein
VGMCIRIMSFISWYEESSRRRGKREVLQEDEFGV